MDSVEVYVLCRVRAKATGIAFLDRFLPCRRSSVDEFPFPEFSDTPQNVYHNSEELMERLEMESNQTYSLYWDGDDSNPGLQAMLFFTCDGSMIAGLVVPDGKASRTLVEVAEVVGGRFGFLTTENRPPETSAEFIDLCRESTLPALVNGRFQEGLAG